MPTLLCESFWLEGVLRVRIFFVLLLMLAAAIFAVQNAAVVSVAVFFWRLEASLAIIIGVCLALGAFVGALVAVPRLYRMRGHERRIRAQLADLDAADDVPATPSRGGAAQSTPRR